MEILTMLTNGSRQQLLVRQLLSLVEEEMLTSANIKGLDVLKPSRKEQHT